MCSKRYTVLMFDDQASRWTQVAPKPSQDSPKMAPAWPKMAPSWTQVAPKRTIWLHRGSARAILAFQQGMHVLCFVNNTIWTSYKNNELYKQQLQVGAPAMPNSHQDNPSMAQYDPNIDPSSSQVFLIHLKDCPSMAPNHWRTTYPHHTMAFKQQPMPHDLARRNAR